MSDKEKDGIVTGLVKRVDFTPVPQQRKAALCPAIIHSLTEFAQNTSFVIREPELTKPGRSQGPNEDRYLCQRALEAVKTVLKKYTDLKGRCFTIIDGTLWINGQASRSFFTDIESVSVFPDGDKFVIGVVLTQTKAHKDSKFYFLRDAVRRPVVFEYNPADVDLRNHLQILAAVDKASMGHAFYEFGEAITKGLMSVSNPEVEYPVAVATYLDDVIWYMDRPYRHDYVIQSREYLDVKKDVDFEETSMIQGFLTNHGNFVTRKRGMYQAVKHRLIINTPSFHVQLSTMDKEATKGVEVFMGGIPQPEDRPLGIIVAKTSLFSEDLW